MNVRTPTTTGMAAVLAVSLPLFAANPEDFTEPQLGEIWGYVWQGDSPRGQPPNTDPLSEDLVRKRLTGRWTVLFGVKPDRLTFALSTNRLVEVWGQKDGAAWKKTGQWRVVSDKLVLFLKEDSLPSFVFSSNQHWYVFDPWARTMMAELKREE